jgi:phage terminase small subunit
MPNPPKPNELKRKMGNPGGRPLPAYQDVIPLAPITEIPEPPRPLQADGMAVWLRVWDKGRIWISPGTDIDHVLLLCESYDERAILREKVMTENDWRDRVALRSLDHQIASMLSTLGFNPTDRTRLGFAEVKRESQLDKLIARRAETERNRFQ